MTTHNMFKMGISANSRTALAVAFQLIWVLLSTEFLLLLLHFLHFFFKQMHTDVATGQIHAELQAGTAALEQLIIKLQERSGRLHNQSS